MSTAPQSKADRWFVMLVAAVAIGIAAAMWIDYARAPEGLWRAVHHDRNGHLAGGITYAGAWRAFNLVQVIIETASATVWPPLHGLILGIVMLPSMDYRLGPVVCLSGWCMTVVISAVIAQRMFVDRVEGRIAGALAALFVMASPAFRLLSTDVMLEGLGAGLSALGLLLYLRAMEQPDNALRWRWLGLALTCMFFEKYNYWAMLVASLAVAFCAVEPRRILATLRDWLSSLNLPQIGRSAARDPLLIAAIAIGALATAIYFLKPAPVMVFGKPAGLYPPENLVTIAYALLFLRVALLWRRHRDAFERQVGPALRILAYWHAAPVLLSFLIPKRLFAFVWFLGPNNSNGVERTSPLQSALFQWPGFAEGFHTATWSAMLVIALALLGGAKMVRMRRGVPAIALFPLVSACALLSHPQQQWRFEATWLFGVWICAGVGGAAILAMATSRLTPRARLSVAILTIAAIASAHLLRPTSQMPESVAIRSLSGPSDMEFARAYLPYLQGTEPVGFLTSFGRSDFFKWTVRSDCGCYRVVDAPFNGRTADDARAFAEAWIARTPSERIVVIDAPGVYEIPQIGLTAAIRRGALDAMRAQTRFQHVADVPVPAFNATVAIWRRD